MPDQAGVTVAGFDELVTGSRKLVGDIDKRATSDLERVAQDRAGVVRAIVPRVTGRLAASVQVGTGGVGSLTGRSVVGVSIGDQGTPYAGWIEFGGTRGRPYMPEGRYLYPVALDTQGLEQAVERGTRETIRGFAWEKPRPQA